MSIETIQLIEVTPNGAGRRRAWLRNGKPGNVQTLLRMREIIRSECGLDGGKFNEELYSILSRLMIARNVDGHNDFQVLNAIHEFIADNVIYLRDPAGGNERIQWPLETLYRGTRDADTDWLRKYFGDVPEAKHKTGIGDCDDLTVLEGALIGLAGFDEIYLRADDYTDWIDGYDHVHPKVGVTTDVDPTGILNLDPTAQDRPLGWHLEGSIDWVEVPVFGSPSETKFAGFSGWLDELISAGIQTGITIGAQQYARAQASGAQSREIGAAFEQAAGEATQIYDAIQRQAVITAEDLSAAETVLSALRGFVRQYPIEYVTRQWQSEDYERAFIARLAQIRAAVTGEGAGTTDEETDGQTGTGGGGAGGGTGGGSTTAGTVDRRQLYLIGAAALLGVIGIASAQRGR